jgi:amino acid transporter
MTGRRARDAGGFGTFAGVFTPSILTILGLVLFLRLGFVVGTGGLARALLILVLATSISLLTSLSLSAIATNRRVRGGGDYYLISRTLGIEYGGALGLVLFVAQSLSVAFYCVGFGDSLAAVAPGAGPLAARWFSAGALAGLLGLAYVGADLATRFQFVIMAVLAAGLASLFAGTWGAWSPPLLAASWRPLAGSDASLWPLFAIFFPAVTGFTQGVSMSGELRDPGRSIPLGTFLAVGVSTLIYLAAMLALAASVPQAELAGDYGAMRSVAASAPLVDAAVLAATLSSALASLLGAPRILQALARDRVFGVLAPFAAGDGAGANPRRGVVLSGAIALAAIGAGSLDALAAIVAMFFLISYALLNYATYVEARAASPSFRPRFRFFHARASLAGALLCAAAMVAISPIAGAFAAAVLAALYQYAKRTAVPVRWRDSRRAYRFRRVREGLRELALDPETAADWQPQVLVFSEGAERRDRLLRFATWITGGSGLVTAVQLVEGEPTSPSVAQRCRTLERRLREDVEKLDLDVHALVIAAPELRVGAEALVQSWGAGPLRANTVVLNWQSGAPSETARLWYGRMVSVALRLGRNLVIVDADETAWTRLAALSSDRRRIDVWWLGDETSRLSLLIAYLMTREPEWDDATLRVLHLAEAGDRERAELALRRRLDEARIDAELEVLDAADAEAVVARSQDAAVVLLPIRVEGMRVSTPLTEDLPALLARLPVAAMVAAAQDVPLTERPDAPPADPEPETR